MCSFTGENLNVNPRMLARSVVLYALLLLDCRENISDPCDGVICSEHGRCISNGGTVSCECDEGYQPDGRSCIPDELGSCQYPSGPYGLGEGEVIAPMQWVIAAAGQDTQGEASLRSIHCDSEVHSVFIAAVNIPCSACPDRMREIARLSDHWEQYGARWIFIVDNAASIENAHEYVERYGITFGHRTDDLDNSEGSGAIALSSIYESMPWTGVIRTSDMVMVYDDSDQFIDLESVAVELAGE